MPHHPLKKELHQQQESDCVHFSKIGFNKIVRQWMRDFAVRARFSKDAIAILQIVTEDMIVERLFMAKEQQFNLRTYNSSIGSLAKDSDHFAR